MNESIEQLHRLPLIEVVYGGGTISSLATAEGHREGGHGVDLVALLQEQRPGYEAPFEVGEKTVAYTGLSENMNKKIWADFNVAIVEALDRGADGVVLTHGTDSMEQTAAYLDYVFGVHLALTNRNIVLTGANEDIEHPETDAWDNLQFALENAASADHLPGVYVAFHGKLIPAKHVVKLPYFREGDSTFVTISDPLFQQKLDEQKVRDDRLIANLFWQYEQTGELSTMLYRVNQVVDNHDELYTFLAHRKFPSVLLELYHSGTANTETPEQSVAIVAAKLREMGIVCFGVTENGEPVDLHSYETSVKLREAGVVPLYDMPKNVAYAKLNFIGRKAPSELINEMLTNKVGEIDPGRIIPEDIEALKQLYSGTTSPR